MAQTLRTEKYLGVVLLVLVGEEKLYKKLHFTIQLLDFDLDLILRNFFYYDQTINTMHEPLKDDGIKFIRWNVHQH